MLRVIKALLGIALIMVGPMLIVITVDDTVIIKNHWWSVRFTRRSFIT